MQRELIRAAVANGVYAHENRQSGRQFRKGTFRNISAKVEATRLQESVRRRNARHNSPAEAGVRRRPDAACASYWPSSDACS